MRANKFLIILFIFSTNVVTIQYLFSQSNNDSLKAIPTSCIRFKGFVKNDFWFDSRQVVSSREDLFLLYPTNRVLDNNGNDLNDNSSVNFSAMTTRLTMDIVGPNFKNAKTSGILEGDFSGVSNNDINGLRLRLATIKLTWQHSELLFGQFWHPNFTLDAVPSVISLNTGAPFQPFTRNPQIGYTYKFGSINASAFAIAQRDNANDGSLGLSSIYIRRAIIPNVFFQVKYSSSKWAFGTAIDFKEIKPRIQTDNRVKINENIKSLAVLAYGKYTHNFLCIKTKSILGQNLSEHLMLGGYAVHDIDSINGKQTYTNLNHLFTWLNINYGNKLQVGLFLGYSKNLGSINSIIGKYYGRAFDIDLLYRVAPSFSIVSQKLQLSTELEYTTAYYGQANSYGIITAPKAISNLRLLFTTFYFF